MAVFIAYLLFLVILFVSVRLLFTKEGILSSPYDREVKMKCTGMELLVIFIFATGLLAIQPLIAIRLAMLEVLCIVGIILSRNRVVFSIPIILFLGFLLWALLGLTYTSSIPYGIRMILKYAAPLLVCMFASSVVRDGEIFLKALQRARLTGLIALLVLFVPFVAYLFYASFWHQAAIVTHFITLAMFSLALFFFTNEKKQNLLWFMAFALPCVFKVFRTDIMGTMLALCAFFTIKYRVKAIPMIVVLACLSVASIFYIPSVKSKMYHNPDAVTVTDFLTGNVDENNINTSGRKTVWEEAMRIYESNNEWIGSGTGTIQHYLYENYNFGAQLHGDFLVMLVDNGKVGLILFLIMYLAVILHCIWIYHQSDHNLIKLCAIASGSSLIGVMATMYSDNTISFSLATLALPWGMYGMVLGMLQKQKSCIYG